MSRLPLLFSGLWAAACVATILLRLAPPQGARGAAAIALFGVLLALAHAAVWLLLERAVSRPFAARRWRRGFDGLFACLVGAAYGLLGLSLIKYAYSRSHLRFEDLWFLLGNLRQLVGEGSAHERLLLGATLALPVGLAVTAWSVARRFPASSPEPSLGKLALFSVCALGSLLLFCRQSPEARRAAEQLLPETSAVARLVERLGSRGALPAKAAAGGTWSADPSRSARIGHDVAGGPVRRDNVVVVMLESVPWARLFGPLSRPESTPRLLELAGESVVFSHAYATATHSDYAQTSILASLHPRKFEGHDYFVELEYPRTLIWDLFRPAGYRTALFSCQNESWGNMRAFLRTPGLELFRHSPDWPEAPRRGEGAESKVFEATPVAGFTSWLAEDREVPRAPFLAYLNFQATHYPYVIEPEAERLYEPSEIDFATTFLSYPKARIPVMENRFHNALSAVDSAVGAVVDALRAAGVWDRTVLLVVADHGEAFYEHGVPTHGTMLLEEQVRSAALLRLPGQPARVVTEPISVLDLVPTVTAFLGLPPHGNFQGRSDVLSDGYSARDRPFLLTIQGITREDAVVENGWKLLRNLDRRELALFDLTTDPTESRNLAASEPARREALARRLDSLLADQLGYYRERGWRQGWYPPRLP